MVAGYAPVPGAWDSPRFFHRPSRPRLCLTAIAIARLFRELDRGLATAALFTRRQPPRRKRG